MTEVYGPFLAGIHHTQIWLKPQKWYIFQTVTTRSFEKDAENSDLILRFLYFTAQSDDSKK